MCTVHLSNKGIEEFLEAARRLPGLPFAVAGNYDRMPRTRENAPSNVRWLGFLSGDDLDACYKSSRILVFPSRCYEGFPSVVTRAMVMGKPVVASNIGALGEIVEDGITGKLVSARDAGNLATAIYALYKNTAACAEMGRHGRSVAMFRYSAEAISNSLLDIYRAAAGMHRVPGQEPVDV